MRPKCNNIDEYTSARVAKFARVTVYFDSGRCSRPADEEGARGIYWRKPKTNIQRTLFFVHFESP